MNIEKLADSLFASNEVDPRDELSLVLFHHLFKDETKRLDDVREILSHVSIAQLENLYYEVDRTECFSEDGEIYLSLGERVHFHIGENENTYFNSYCWKLLKPITKKKFI